MSDDRELTTTARLLGALSLLQARPQWSGPELAERFGVTVRTIRRDMDRLRQLGYPIEAVPGAVGGYRMGSGGSAMPPLMLDRDEAVAVAVCLRSAAIETVAGGGEAAVRVLGKLEQLLPSTLRRQVATVVAMTARLDAQSEPVAPDVLVALTRACRDAERLRVRYRDARGAETERTIDPYRVVSTSRRWYLVAHDRARRDWRTFRVDRFVGVDPTGHRVELPEPPDPVAFVQAAIAVAPYAHQVRVELAAPIDELRALVPATVAALEPLGPARTMLTTGADDLDMIAFHLLSLDVDFTVVATDALRTRLAELAARLQAVVSRSADGDVGYVTVRRGDADVS